MDYKELSVGQLQENFWFKAKKDLIDILMKKICENKKIKKLKILNIGIGTGDELEVLNKYGNNYIIDINEKALSLINKNFYFEKKLADACKIPYKDNFFDVVICLDVLEHVKDDKKAVDEIFRVLKNKGFLVFSVPAFQFLFSSHDKALSHERRYNKKIIKSLFSKFVIKIFFWNSLLFIPIAFIRLCEKYSKPKIDKINFPSWLNDFFLIFLKFDNFLIKRNISMPIGLSIVGFCIKKS